MCKYLIFFESAGASGFQFTHRSLRMFTDLTDNRNSINRLKNSFLVFTHDPLTMKRG